MLPCNFSGHADKMRWYFGTTIIYDKVLGDHSAYKSECNPETQVCNIGISECKIKDAGTYRFEHGKAGMQMDVACRHELVIGGLECKSNLRKNQIIIGESDSPMKPEILSRSCAFKFNGSYDGSLQFVWMKRRPFVSIWRDKVLNASSATMEGHGNILKVEDDIVVTNGLDGVIFECYLMENNYIRPCELPSLSVQFVKNASDQSKPIHTSAPKHVSCSITKSPVIGCTYDWVITKGNVVLKIEGRQNLSDEHLLVAGYYTCIAACHFVTGEVHSFRGTQFEFMGGTNGSRAIKIILGIFVVVFLFIIVVLSVILYRTRSVKSKRSRRTNNEHLQEKPH